jgi:hypothetical protein
MADRGLLHRADLEPFARWAISKGWERRPAQGYYEVLHITKLVRAGLAGHRRVTHVFYRKLRAKEHVSVPDSAERLVRQFLKHKRRRERND